jgi:hypothetical protein
VRRFEAVYSPELAGGDVVFTDSEMIAGKRYAAPNRPKTTFSEIRKSSLGYSGKEVLKPLLSLLGSQPGNDIIQSCGNL